MQSIWRANHNAKITRIDYWVFGDVGIADYTGKFIRDNGDVDTFVKEANFEKAWEVLDKVCTLKKISIDSRYTHKRKT